MTITKVYFVRHAQSDYTVKDDYKRPLTVIGLDDTRKVTKALKNRNIVKIYSSPYQRTVDTVKDLAQYFRQDIFIVDDFREREVGTWVEDFKVFSKKQWDDFDYKLECGESLREVQNRNISALNRVIQENQGKEIVIGTHGTALSTIINYFDSGFGYERFWNIIDKMPYILCFQFEDQRLINIEELEL